MTKLYNQHAFRQLRKGRRRTMPEPEKKLWHFLRNRQFLNLKLSRQYGVGQFIIDFYCPELKLGIQLDGGSHYREHAVAYDSTRTHYMKQADIRIIRFANTDVMNNIEGVLTETERAVGQQRPPYQGGE